MHAGRETPHLILTLPVLGQAHGATIHFSWAIITPLPTF